MNFAPLNDRMLVRRVEKEEKSAGGIILPDSAKEKPMEGEVLAIGKGHRNDDGTFRALDVKVGSKVLFAKYSGDEVKLEGEEYMILREDDILAVFTS